MPAMILDETLAAKLIAERAARGLDHFDEVWEGTYVMAPAPNNEHQWLVAKLTRCLDEIIGDTGRGSVLPGVNISDRDQGWETNYRIPDIAVFLRGSSAVDKGSHWFGGPELAIEVASRGDRTREKLEFYAKVGTSELLVVDRDPWCLELYRWSAKRLLSSARCSPESPQPLDCQTVPLRLTLVPTASHSGSAGRSGSDRPPLRIESLELGLRWEL